MSEPPQPVLVIASDTIGPAMAGSGIRYWHLAQEIGRQQPVTLATPAPVALQAPEGVTIVPYGGDDQAQGNGGEILARMIEQHSTVVAQHLPYLHISQEVLAERNIVVDLYAPWILEKLEYARIDPERGEPDRKDDVEILNRLLMLGDFFICASERQRDFWLGALAAAGRLDLAYSRHDPDLRNLIDIVSFGLPGRRPLPAGNGPRDLFPRIGQRDPLLLWNGGLWNWLDALTAIRATGLLAQDNPRIRLVFMGTSSPGAQVAEMEVVETARELARELGLLDRNVFFNEWVPYEERQTWLLQSNATLSLHLPTVESRFAFRTRVLDNIWCGTPIVATGGDVLADLVESNSIGVTVPPGDAVAVANAVRTILEPEAGREMRSNLATLRGAHSWDRVAGPLLAFCRDPWSFGSRRTVSVGAAYVSKLERLYMETQRYAQDLERVVAEKNAALVRAAQEREPGLFKSVFGRRSSR